MNPRNAVTYGVFEASDREQAEAIAEELTARNHLVYLHEGDAFTRRKLPMQATALRRSVVSGAGIVGIASLGLLTVAHLLGILPTGVDATTGRFWAVLAVSVTFGGLAGAFSGAMEVAPELERAEEALSSEPGRFAVMVTSGRARRPFIEARLARAGAVTVGSV